MNRRTFIQAILAASMAPAIVKAANLMPVRALDSGLLVLWGDGVHDDAPALQAWLEGKPIVDRGGLISGRFLTGGTFLVRETLIIDGPGPKHVIAGTTFQRDPALSGPVLWYRNAERGLITGAHVRS